MGDEIGALVRRMLQGSMAHRHTHLGVCSGAMTLHPGIIRALSTFLQTVEAW